MCVCVGGEEEKSLRIDLNGFSSFLRSEPIRRSRDGGTT